MAVGHEIEQGGKRPRKRGDAGAERRGALRTNGADRRRQIPESDLDRAPRRAPRGARRRLPRSGSPPPARASAPSCNRAFNELAERRESFSKEVARVGRAIGREGRLTERAARPRARRPLGRHDERAQHADRRPRPPDDRGRARDRRRRRRRPLAEDGADDRGAAREGRVPPHRHDRQRDGRPALVVRRRGDARRARGRHRRQARRPGEGEGRHRRLEGPDGQRQHARRRT